MRRAISSKPRHVGAAAAKSALTATLLLSLSTRSPAAESAASPDERRPTTLLGGSIGVGHLQLTDEIVRGLRWSGPAGEVRGFFTDTVGANWHLSNFRFPVGFIENRYGHAGVAWDAQLDYGYARRIGNTGGSIEWALGGVVRWDWALQYYADFDEEHLYWMNAYELAPLIAGRYDVHERAIIVAQLDLPIFELVSRPPAFRYYKIDKLTHPSFFFKKTHQDFRATSLHEHVASRLRLAYQQMWGRHAAIEARYAFDFVYEAEPRRFLLLMHTLSFGVAYAY